MHLKGLGVDKNLDKATHYLRKFAIYGLELTFLVKNSKNLPSKFRFVIPGIIEMTYADKIIPVFGKVYGVEYGPHFEKAVHWAKQFHVRGLHPDFAGKFQDVDGMTVTDAFELGRRYLKGDGLPRDPNVGYMIWYIIHDYHPEAGFRVALALDKHKWSHQRLLSKLDVNSWMRKSAAAGNINAIMELYRRTDFLRPHEKQDLTTAAACLYFAQKLGHDVSKEFESLRKRTKDPYVFSLGKIGADDPPFTSKCQISQPDNVLKRPR
ncbi:MAG: hypothetical protein O2912_02235 [Proteobacteria bacterium]|nr:hypothetical protein [Pseudomonadota bacterium]